MDANPHHDTEPSQDFVYRLAAWVKKHIRNLLPVAIIVVALIGVSIFLLTRSDSPSTSKVALTTANSGSDSSSTSNTNLHVSDLWDNNVHGLLAIEDNDNSNYLELLNPNSGSLIAKVLVPQNGTYNGRKYTAGFDLGISNYGGVLGAHNNTYRYEAIEFSPASDGATDVGYYDLETGKVYDATPKSAYKSGDDIIKDSAPAFDSNNSNLLVFTRTITGTGFTAGEQASQQTWAYNLTTKQSLLYFGTTTGSCIAPLQYAPDSGNCELMGQGPSAGVGFADDGMKSLGVDPTPNQNNPNNYESDNEGDTYTPVETTSGGQTTTVNCSPDQWLPNNNLLCDSNDGSNILVVNVSSFSLGSDGNYQVPSSTDLLPTNQRDNGNAIASPSGKTVDFLSSGAIYQVAASGGSPHQILPATPDPTGTANDDYRLLSWR